SSNDYNEDSNVNEITWEEVYPSIALFVMGMDIWNTVLSVIGCIGNIFVLLIISQWKLMSSGAAFMYSLALTDFLSLFWDGIIDELLPLLGFVLTDVHNIICAAGKFFNFASTVASYYLTVLFGLDKCLAVVFPFKYREYGKPNVCIVATLLVYLAMVAYAFYAPFVYRLDPETGVCKPINFEIVTPFFLYDVRPYITFTFGGVVPIIGSFLVTGITVLKLRQNAKNRAQEQSSKTRPPQQSRRDAEITRQMLVVCFLFGCLALFNSAIVRINFSVDVKTLRDEAMVRVRDRFLSCSLALMNSANFFIYLIFGKKFRADFLNLFNKGGDVNSQITSTGNKNATANRQTESK
ncbi:uncharacterized protein LOC142355792, partial [Convolutriloba macropyga]|uniref:uncharacterized protein LOC142355792 n=1 Tax=Convolutriloba macropyga TaxID=536237 RepID=UPI003F521F7B